MRNYIEMQHNCHAMGRSYSATNPMAVPEYMRCFNHASCFWRVDILMPKVSVFDEIKGGFRAHNQH